MERKSLAIIIVVVIVAAAGITIPLLIIYSAPAAKTHLKFGVMYEMRDLEPVRTWDSASISVMDQIVERLYTQDLTLLDMPVIPCLATGDGSWSADNLVWTIPIREGVTFHDGTPLNASAVKWNFDRIMWFENITGEYTGLLPDALCLWMGKINKTEVVSEYVFKITLNKACGFFQAIMCYASFAILSPTSHAAEKEVYIDLATGDLVGTGPYVYDNFEAGVEVNMHAWENYWRPEGPAKIKTITYTVITDADSRNAALLTGDIDIIDAPNPPLIGLFNATDFIHVTDPIGSTITQFLGMNNVLINRNIREAISAAFNIDYVIEVLRAGYAIRMKSFIPPGIPGFKEFNASTYDITWARLLMKSEFPAETADLNMSTLSTNSDWRDLVADGNELMLLNYTYNIGNPTREAILPLLQSDMPEIGIKIEDAGMTWPSFLDRGDERGLYHRNMLQLWWIGWAPDYPDPENYINTFLTNETIAFNWMQYNNPGAQGNDWHVQDWMMEAATITDMAARQVLYDKIQKKVIEIDKPIVMGYIPAVIDAYHVSLKGVLTNPADNDWFYTCYFEE